MYQKTIFTVIEAILVLKGIFFFTMCEKVITDAFPTIDEAGKTSAMPLLQVMAVLSVIVGLITYAARNTPQVLWAYTIGFALFTILSLKHLLADHINVPIPALVI